MQVIRQGASVPVDETTAAVETATALDGFDWHQLLFDLSKCVTSFGHTDRCVSTVVHKQ